MSPNGWRDNINVLNGTISLVKFQFFSKFKNIFRYIFSFFLRHFKFQTFASRYLYHFIEWNIVPPKDAG